MTNRKYSTVTADMKVFDQYSFHYITTITGSLIMTVYCNAACFKQIWSNLNEYSQQVVILLEKQEQVLTVVVLHPLIV